MAVYTKVSGSWRPITNAYVKVSDVYRTIMQIYIKVDTAWRPVWTFDWGYSGWGGCSASCDCGQMYRDVYCVRSNGLRVADSYCSSTTRPADWAWCNCDPCFTYRWVYDAFPSPCPAVCKTIVQTRTVACQNQYGTTVSDDYCIYGGAGTKPATQQQCTDQCSWKYEAWDTYCTPRECASNSVRERTVQCISPRAGSTLWTNCIPQLGNPVTTQSCNTCAGNGCWDNYRSESAVLCAKAKKENSTPAAMLAAIQNAGYTVWSWYDLYGVSEKICPWYNIIYSSGGVNYGGCCPSHGLTYYC